MDILCAKQKSFDLDLNTTFSNFDELAILLHKKDLLKNTELILNNIDTNFFNTRELLSSYMVYKFPEDVLGITNDATELLKKTSYDMLVSFEKVCYNYMNSINDKLEIIKLKNLYTIYSKTFRTWKKDDLNLMKQVLVEAYNDIVQTSEVVINKSASEDEKKLLIETFELYKKETMDKLIKLAGKDEATKLLDEYESPKEETLTVEEMEKIMKKAFWDKFKEDLSQEPPNHDMMYELIKDIKNKFINLTPNNNHQKNKMNDVLDIDFIKQQIDHKVFTPFDLIGKLRFIIDEILSLCAPSEDNEFKEWQRQMEIRFNEGFEYADTIPIIFREILEKLDKIEIRLKIFMDSLQKSKSINKDDKMET